MYIYKGYKDQEARRSYQCWYQSVWRIRNKEKIVENRRKKRKESRLKCLEFYSKGSFKCPQCGYNDIRALDIDHIDDNGSYHRKIIKRASIYIWLIQNNFPEGYQVLCKNCNWIKFLVHQDLQLLN